MSLFDQLVDQALSRQVESAPLRVVVEKELLHHDIMRVLSDCGMLERLCFIGGTCLRACYGSNRLSEDEALRKRMGAAGRLLAEREFAIEKVVQQHLDIYAELEANRAQ